MLLSWQRTSNSNWPELSVMGWGCSIIYIPLKLPIEKEKRMKPLSGEHFLVLVSNIFTSWFLASCFSQFFFFFPPASTPSLSFSSQIVFEALDLVLSVQLYVHPAVACWVLVFTLCTFFPALKWEENKLIFNWVTDMNLLLQEACCCGVEVEISKLYIYK